MVVSWIIEFLLFRRKQGFNIAVDTLNWRLVIGILVWHTEICAELILVGSFDVFCALFLLFESTETAVLVRFSLSVVQLFFSMVKLHL